jgi:large subunit ribosomal protein L1
MHTASKRMKKATSQVDIAKIYSLSDALDLVETFPKVKFDETVEVHFSLNVDPKSADQIVRGTVPLPHGTGKTVRIIVFCKGEAEKKAQDAGADMVGSNDLIEKIVNGFLDFDVVIATPDMMRDISKLGKVLGPRGLMPTPKAGTVTVDVEKAIREVKAGKVEFKADKQGGIHLGVGRRSFTKQQLVENITRLLDALIAAKPTAVKGQLIKSFSISTTMGPGVKVAL